MPEATQYDQLDLGKHGLSGLDFEEGTDLIRSRLAASLETADPVDRAALLRSFDEIVDNERYRRDNPIVDL